MLMIKRNFSTLTRLGIFFLLVFYMQASFAEVKNIQGFVVDAISREKLNNVNVQLIKNGNMIEQQSINQSSSFFFKNDFQAADKYKLIVVKNGYINHEIDLSNAISYGQMPEQLMINLGGEEASFTFTGYIRNRESFVPVGNIKIVSVNLMTGETVINETDIDGKYSLNIIAGYEYKIIFKSGGYLKRFAKINYCPDRLDKLNIYCFSGFNEISLNPNGGVSGASVLLDKVEIGKKFKVDNIYYDYNKATLRKDAIPNLRKVLYILDDNKQISIELGSHADSRGSDKYNLKLSDRRAKSAVSYIVKEGIESKRITAHGYGETILLNHCANKIKCTDTEHGLNRRTEFIIIDIDETKIDK